MSRPKKPTTPFVPRTRERGEAMPYDIHTKGKKYEAAKHSPSQPVRPGADDHARYVSRGF